MRANSQITPDAEKSRRNRRFIRRIPLGHLGYWAAALVICLTGLAVYEADSHAKASNAAVEHSLVVLADIASMSELLGRAEAAQRAYLLTGRDRFVAERDEAISGIRSAAQRLKHAFAGNTAQTQALARLEPLFEQRFELMYQNAARRASEGLDPAAAVVGNGRSQQLGAKITAVIDELRLDERNTLDARRAAANADYDNAVRLLLTTVLVSLGVLVPGYIGFIAEARARRKAEARLYDLADSLPGALYRIRTAIDGKRSFEFLSHGVERLRAVDRRAAMRDFSMMWNTIVGEDRDRIAEIMARGERELGAVQYEFRVVLPDARLRWLRASATVRREPDGSALWNGYWSDITHEKVLLRELHEARDAADAASRAKSTFLATMSHEIRTPMNGVLGMLELLALTRLDSEQRTTLGIIRESGRSLLRIIDDILDFSKIEAGKLDVRPEPASIADVVERVCNVYSGNASSKGLLLKRHVDPRISPALMVDPLRLQQILNNFVSNAIKFTERGEVEVRADLVAGYEHTDRVRLTVRDTGIGVSEEQRARLFAPFVQANDDPTRSYGGTGLGLSISRRLAEMMGGAVEMESEPARGTRMILTLELEKAAEGAAVRPASGADRSQGEAPALSRTAPSVEQARAERRLVLIVDDHPINRMVLTKQVNMLGYAVEAASDGLEALDKWSAGGVGAILTDCNMPQMNGYALARHIRTCEARNRHERVPIIACTANALAGEAENCFSAGMDDYVAKPIDLRALAEKLGHWLPADAAPDSRVQVIDRQALREISGGDSALEAEMLSQFWAHNEADTQGLHAALAGRDIAKVAGAAHRIKGASRSIGAARLAAICGQMEQAARAGQWHAVHAAADSLAPELHKLKAAIEALGSVAPPHPVRGSAMEGGLRT